MATDLTLEGDLVAQVRDLAARRDINAAVQRYMRGLDRLDPDLQRSAFHPDATIDCGLMVGGVEEFVAFSQDLLAGMDATHHMLGQVSLEVDPADGRASGECYFQAWHRTGNEAEGWRDLFIAGRYLDAYACRDGEWRIAARTLVTDWVRDDPGTIDFFAANPDAPRGGRRGADPSENRNRIPIAGERP
ncbi:hypothetical protein B2G71_01535 [Novosphingobium sp. PC22D]|uniref:nuclear transport factor 2 family protein n=1 Tax=Novosphingobium sp. PC22D TaxID=1962403 RepID=UPI000BEFF9BD|nr:nuclear transport factor 2 family protein [Novosphingobium sp. PC22D]PEQ14311.1 hypothetical protein B2G71_01535 [Novosphingobium sp. PC22D]